MDAPSATATTPLAQTNAPMEEEDFFAALDASDMTEEDKAGVLLQIMQVVQTKVLGRAYGLLKTQEDKDQMVAYLEDNDVEGIDTMLTEKVPNYLDLYEEEARLLRRELITKMVA